MRVVPRDAARVQAVRLAVGYDLDVRLQRAGDAWTAEAEVPWDAPAGTYSLSFLAYDADQRTVESAEERFTVEG